MHYFRVTYVSKLSIHTNVIRNRTISKTRCTSGAIVVFFSIIDVQPKCDCSWIAHKPTCISKDNYPPITKILHVRASRYTIHNTQYTIHNTQYTIHNTQYTIHNSETEAVNLQITNEYIQVELLGDRQPVL